MKTLKDIEFEAGSGEMWGKNISLSEDLKNAAREWSKYYKRSIAEELDTRCMEYTTGYFQGKIDLLEEFFNLTDGEE